MTKGIKTNSKTPVQDRENLAGESVMDKSAIAAIDQPIAGIGHNDEKAIRIETLNASIDRDNAALNAEFKVAKENKRQRAIRANQTLKDMLELSKLKGDWHIFKNKCAESDEFGVVMARIFNSICLSHEIQKQKGKYYLMKLLDAEGKPLHKKVTFDNDALNEVKENYGRIDEVIKDLNLKPEVQPTLLMKQKEYGEKAKKLAKELYDSGVEFEFYVAELRKEWTRFYDRDMNKAE